MFQELHENRNTTNFLEPDDTPLYHVATTVTLPPLEDVKVSATTEARQMIRLLVRYGNSVSELTLPEAERFVLGRLSIHNPQQPNVDLTDFNAMSLGVSRLHALIEDHLNIFTITDLYSSNGTWLNGRRLEPNEIRFLHDRDTICLGKLVVYVRIIELIDA
jgi:FHA domain